MTKWLEHIKKDRWLYLALTAAICLCLFWPGSSPPDTATGDETRLASILSAMEGVGHARTAIFLDGDDLPAGVVVVADGAEDVAVQLRITRTVMTLLHVEPDQIMICPSKEGSP